MVDVEDFWGFDHLCKSICSFAVGILCPRNSLFSKEEDADGDLVLGVYPCIVIPPCQYHSFTFIIFEEIV